MNYLTLKTWCYEIKMLKEKSESKERIYLVSFNNYIYNVILTNVNLAEVVLLCLKAEFLSWIK